MWSSGRVSQKHFRSRTDDIAGGGRSTAASGSGHHTARSAYRNFHKRALDEAWRLGREGGNVAQAMAREAAAQHDLPDAFAAGDLRTPVATIRSHWKARYQASGISSNGGSRPDGSGASGVSWTLRALSDSAP